MYFLGMTALFTLFIRIMYIKFPVQRFWNLRYPQINTIKGGKWVGRVGYDPTHKRVIHTQPIYHSGNPTQPV